MADILFFMLPFTEVIALFLKESRLSDTEYMQEAFKACTFDDAYLKKKANSQQFLRVEATAASALEIFSHIGYEWLPEEDGRKGNAATKAKFLSFREKALAMFAMVQNVLLSTGTGGVLWTLPTFDVLVFLALALIADVQKGRESTEKIESQIPRVLRLLKSALEPKDEDMWRTASEQCKKLASSFFDVLHVPELDKLHSTVAAAAQRLLDPNADAGLLGIPTITKLQKTNTKESEGDSDGLCQCRELEITSERDKFVPDSNVITNFDEAFLSMPYVDIDPNLDRIHMYSFPQMGLTILKSRMYGEKGSLFALEQFCCSALLARQQSALIATLKDAANALQVHGYKEEESLALRLWMEEGVLSQFWVGARSLVDSIVGTDDLYTDFEISASNKKLEDDTLRKFLREFVLNWRLLACISRRRDLSIRVDLDHDALGSAIISDMFRLKIAAFFAKRRDGQNSAVAAESSVPRAQAAAPSQGSVATSQGDVATPQGEVATPQGSVATPQGSVATPQGDVATPQRGAKVRRTKRPSSRGSKASRGSKRRRKT